MTTPIQTTSRTPSLDLVRTIEGLVSEMITRGDNDAPSCHSHALHIEQVLYDSAHPLSAVEALSRWGKLYHNTQIVLGCEGFLKVVAALDAQAAERELTMPRPEVDV